MTGQLKISNKRKEMSDEDKWLSVLFQKDRCSFLSAYWRCLPLWFFLSRITPIDPLQSYYGERVEKMSEEQKDSARERLGLNDPIPVQYVRWLKLALSGDFGISYKYKQDVTIVIKERIQKYTRFRLIKLRDFIIGALLLGFYVLGMKINLQTDLLCALERLQAAFLNFGWHSY